MNKADKTDACAEMQGTMGPAGMVWQRSIKRDGIRGPWLQAEQNISAGKGIRRGALGLSAGEKRHLAQDDAVSRAQGGAVSRASPAWASQKEWPIGWRGCCRQLGSQGGHAAHQLLHQQGRQRHHGHAAVDGLQPWRRSEDMARLRYRGCGTDWARLGSRQPASVV